MHPAVLVTNSQGTSSDRAALLREGTGGRAGEPRIAGPWQAKCVSWGLPVVTLFFTVNQIDGSHHHYGPT